MNWSNRRSRPLDHHCIDWVPNRNIIHIRLTRGMNCVGQHKKEICFWYWKSEVFYRHSELGMTVNIEKININSCLTAEGWGTPQPCPVIELGPLCVGCWCPIPSTMWQLLLKCVYFSLLKTLIRPFDTRYLKNKIFIWYNFELLFIQRSRPIIQASLAQW